MSRLRNRGVRARDPPPPSAAAAAAAAADAPIPPLQLRRRRQGIASAATSRTTRTVRVSLLVVCGAYWAQRRFLSHLVLPWGPAVRRHATSSDATGSATAPEYIPLEKIPRFDALNDQPGRLHKIYAQPPLRGPETIVFHKDGSMYILSEDGKLIRVQDFVDVSSNSINNESTSDVRRIHATSVVVSESLGGGRPLGGRFTHNTLYIADAILGLTRIRNIRDPKAKLEIVASTVQEVTDPLSNTTTTSRIHYADDVVIGPRTGHVYFTDATDILVDYTIVPSDDGGLSSPSPGRLQRRRRWDTMYASKADGMRGVGTGRILQYNPRTDETTVLVGGLRFANGIAVDQDETYLVVAETFGVNLLRYNLKNGTLDVLVHGRDLPGYLDGVDCSHTGTSAGLCYAVMPSAIVPLHRLWLQLPSRWSQVLRTVLLMVPRWLAPSVRRFGGLVEVNPATKEFRLILDRHGRDMDMLTGVTVQNDKLFLGSLNNDYVGVYNLKVSNA